MMRLFAAGSFILALALWGAFGFLVYDLSGERSELAVAQAEAREQGVRGESASRVRATIQDTQAERALLETTVKTPILEAIEIIESAGVRAGASDVTIGNATPSGDSPLEGSMTVQVVVNAEGTFSSLVRTVRVFETLPLPSKLEQFEIEFTDDTWRLTARMRLIVAASNL